MRGTIGSEVELAGVSLISSVGADQVGTSGAGAEQERLLSDLSVTLPVPIAFCTTLLIIAILTLNEQWINIWCR